MMQKMRQSAKVLFGLWCFLFPALIAAAIVSNADTEDSFGYYYAIMFALFSIPSLVCILAYVYYIFPKYLQQQKMKTGAVLAILIACGSAAIGCVFLYFTNSFVLSCHLESNFLGPLLMTGIGVCAGFIGLIIKGFLTWYDELKIKEALLKRNLNVEMALVKSQFDPHFLFNTINNIDVLIEEDPARASQYLNQLSDLMRFVLYDTGASTIPLETELVYIEKYVALQKLRTTNAAFVALNIEGDPSTIEIAPMLFIPFVENAFKHVHKKAKDAINIKFNIDGDRITMHCVNKLNEKNIAKSSESNGLGNGLVRKRLQLLYPKKHTLQHSKHNGQYEVALSVQL